MWPLGQMLGPLGRAMKRGITYLLRDEFTTDQDAPLTSPRTCEPGPGTLTISDAGGSFSISGGRLIHASNATTAVITMAQMTRVPGMVLRFDVINPNPEYVDNQYWAWSTTGADITDGMEGGYRIWASGVGILVNQYSGGTYTIKTFNILRAAGNFTVVYKSSTGLYTLHWINHAGTYNPYVRMRFTNRPQTYDNLMIAKLGAPWTDDWGITTGYTASPASGASLAHEANCTAEITWTASAGVVAELDVRRTDADNRWIVRCDQAGGTVKLIERQAGVEIERSSVAQTWTAGTAYRVVAVADGTTIKTFVSNVAKNTWASATFNQTATTAMITASAGALSTFVTWPRTLSGAALAALHEVAA